MPRLCAVCRHAERRQIDADLLVHATTYREIARRYGVQDDAIIRHEHHHLAMSWEQSKALQAMVSAQHLVNKLEQLEQVTRAMLVEARQAGDLRGALAAVRESRELVVAIARVASLDLHDAPLRDVRERRARYDASVHALQQHPSWQPPLESPAHPAHPQHQQWLLWREAHIDEVSDTELDAIVAGDIPSALTRHQRSMGNRDEDGDG